MKKIFIIVAVLCAMIASAHAQENKIGTAFFFGGGMAAPLEPNTFKDCWNPGFNFGGGVEFEITRLIDIQTTFFFTIFPLDKEAYLDLDNVTIDSEETGLTIDGGSARVFEVMVNAKVKIISNESAKRVKPYILGGLGFGTISYSDLAFSYDGGFESKPIDDVTTNMGINFGAGIDIPINTRMRLFVEGKHIRYYTEGDDVTYLPFRAGLIVRLDS